MISCLVAEPEFARQIQAALEGTTELTIAAVTPDLAHLTALMEEHQPALILLGPHLSPQSVSELLQTEASRFARTVLLVFVSPEAGQVEIPEGLDVEKLRVPLESQALVEVIQRIAQRIARPTPSAPPRAKILTVFSTKGGVGKTMIASNLAVYLAKNTGQRVVVLDLDLQFGDIGVMLKLRPEHTIYDCAPITAELNEEVIAKFLTPHSSGAYALLAPLQPELADLVTVDHLKNVLDALRRYADLIVVDTPASFNDHVLTLLDNTDTVLLVATMDIPSVKNVKLCLQTLQTLQYPDQKIVLTINRADEDLGLKQREIEIALDKDAMVTIPTDKHVPLSINRGTPIVLEAPKSPAARGLASLATHLVKRLTSEKAKVAA